MTLPAWLDSPECRSRAHCPACRLDAAWTARMMRHFQAIPTPWQPCPHGITAATAAARLPSPKSARPAPDPDRCPDYTCARCADGARCRRTGLEDPACRGHLSACVA